LPISQATIQLYPPRFPIIRPTGCKQRLNLQELPLCEGEEELKTKKNKVSLFLKPFLEFQIKVNLPLGLVCGNDLLSSILASLNFSLDNEQ